MAGARDLGRKENKTREGGQGASGAGVGGLQDDGSFLLIESGQL